MAVNAEVQKKTNENSLSLLRRFSRRVQGTGLVRKVRNKRYADRTKSPYVKKKKKLQRLSKQARFEELVKLGKVQPRSSRNGR
ncbi:MAG: hypothetical protein MRY49_01745 [Candidatus Pacebacteria bacterium]|nr:hypothetical protein [Candidatus Paceibacterota bacterium]